LLQKLIWLPLSFKGLTGVIFSQVSDDREYCIIAFRWRTLFVIEMISDSRILSTLFKAT
jgi:hypothetical protein